VSFSGILARGEARQQWLEMGILAIGMAMVALALGLGRHLLVPLRRMEEALLRVTGGNLQVVIGLPREDELGEVTAAFDRMTEGLRERRDLGRFVSGTLDLEGEEARTAEAALLVSDLRQFTTLSETHPPEDIVRMLNHHHETMSQAIHDAGGRVDRFIGDAVVAVFLAPDPAESAAQAVRAAAGMRRAHLRTQQERGTRGEFPYEMGIGLALGTVLLATFGSDRRRERAVIGTPYEEAEMLEAFYKAGRVTRIIASPDLVRHLPGTAFLPLAGTDAWELADLQEKER
jgi:adenylate cyclase